jgi:hypothetical protein
MAAVRIRAHGAGRSDWRGRDSVRFVGAGDLRGKTFCALYRIEKTYLKPCLDARHDINEAMKALLDYRLHKAQTLTQDVPTVVAKTGFLHWLRQRV